jgi:hypothetical protein
VFSSTNVTDHRDMDVSSVAAQVQVQVQRLVLDGLKAQGASQQQLIAASAPPVGNEPGLGRILDVRV